MKTNNKVIVKVVVILLLMGLITTFTHCVPHSSNEVGNGSTNSTYTPPAGDDKDEGQIINEIQVTTGIKNHEQLLHSMGAVTGIDPYTNNNIMQIYRQVESTLPTENDVKLFSSTQQVAVTKLAAEFCFQLTTGTFAAQRMAVWPSLQFTAISGTAFNAANETAFIKDTITSLWGGMLSTEEYNMASNEFKILIDEIINNENTTAATQRTVRGVCTAALSSAYITLL